MALLGWEVMSLDTRLPSPERRDPQQPERPGVDQHHRARRRLPAWPAVVLAIPFLVAGLATLSVGSAPAAQLRSTLLAQFASFTNWGLAAWFAALVLSTVALVLTRRRVLVAGLLTIVVLGTIVQASWVAPFYRANEAPMAAPLRVATLNMEFGAADREQTVALASQADVLVLVEVTPEAVAELRTAGLEEQLPHRLGGGASYADGTAIYSRTPLEPLAELSTGFESRVARVSTGGQQIVIAGVHPANPKNSAAEWASDAVALRDGLQPYLGQNLVVTGDFNAVNRHATMLNLSQDRLSDAADITGAGLQPTWPKRMLPFPVITIDHTMLAPSMTARDFAVHHVDNTDHAALLVTVGLAAT